MTHNYCVQLHPSRENLLPLDHETCDILQEALQKKGSSDDFLGHEGGDDSVGGGSGEASRRLGQRTG